MKNILIIFAVLLFLLTLLSSFGGSIRPAEPFYEEAAASTSDLERQQKELAAIEAQMKQLDQLSQLQNQLSNQIDKAASMTNIGSNAPTTTTPPATTASSMPPPPPAVASPAAPVAGATPPVVEPFEVPEPFSGTDFGSVF